MTIFRGPGGTGSATSDSDTTEFQEFLVQSQAARDAALAAQVAAELAETNAETAETNAETAETNAETAATNAASSASAAVSSASNASTSATNAASSASAASTSATNASASASAAAASASAALTSENNAETAETNAAASASAAASSASTATNQASNAAASASAALASETAAASSASSASSSASAASISASNAATSASNAASSATSAANSASAAAASAASINPADIVHISGTETITGAKTFSQTITGSITGNAGTATNGVVTTGSYADPAWITSLAGSKVSGNISGNAANVTGTVAIANGGTGSTTASTARTALGVAIGTDVLPVTNPSYTGTLTGGTGVVNLGSGQFYKDASGNVGIGTSSPLYPLDVAGIARSNAWIGRANGSAPTADCALYRPADNSLGFSTANTERARIDSNGNLLVGTTNTDPTGNNVAGVLVAPSYINVNRTAEVAGYFGRTSDGNVLLFRRSGGNTGSVSVTSTTTAYNTSSDYRLKENVQPMTGALATVAALKPVKYKWKVDGSDGQGFIAHELQEVVPDCVTGEKDAVDAEGKPIYQGIDTSFLTATLTAAIQEQQAIILAQESALNALTARVAALESN